MWFMPSPGGILGSAYHLGPSPKLNPQAGAGQGAPCYKPYIEQERSSRRCLLAYRAQQRTLPFSLPERMRVSVCRVYCPRTPTQFADLAVLSQDLFSVPPPEVPKTESVLTMVGGKIVFDAKALSMP